MKELTILVTLLVLLNGFPSQSLAKSQLLLPPINAELIISGLEHSESLLKSGNGHFKLYGSAYFDEKKGILGEKKEIDPKIGSLRVTERSRSVVELWFAFRGEHSYFKDQDVEIISDGKTQLYISPGGSISMLSGNPYPPTPLDPRDWGLWYNRQKLSDYLHQQKKVRVIGSEKIDGIPCYIIETLEPRFQDAVVKFWIAPEGGFRLVQILKETKTQKYSTKIEWQEYKIGEKDVIWFPRHAISLFMKSGTEKEFKNEIEITNFQPNIDVSHLFDLPNRISPETRVLNTEIGKFTAFKEIGWQKP